MRLHISLSAAYFMVTEMQAVQGCVCVSWRTRK